MRGRGAPHIDHGPDRLKNVGVYGRILYSVREIDIDTMEYMIL